jgi:iron(III) transport system substrate-binding protein
MFNKKLPMMLAVILFLMLSIGEVFAEEIVIYSARSKILTKKAFNKFSHHSGIKIKLVTGDIDGLLERLKKEGKNSPADILITVDAGSLWKAKQASLFQPIDSDTLTKNIPSHLRDSQNYWFGLSKRARTIVYSSERVQPAELSTYADLAQPKWKDKLCLRTSEKVYNQSLVAMMIKNHGVEGTEKIVKGWVKNLAVEPQNKDTDVIISIVEGQCDVGIVNHYYLGRMVKVNPKLPIGLFWPNQREDEGGVYVDISGAGILKNAKNKENAVKLLNWLSSAVAQSLFANSNMEYPVNQKVKLHPQVQKWGDFKQNTDNISHSGVNQEAAIELMHRAEYQ